MKLAQVQAIFLLADIDIISALPIDNQYNSDDEYKKLSPWWLVQTPHGVIEIGWRRRVIHLGWSNTGVVYPLIDPEGRDLVSFQHPIKGNTTKWETGAHAYGYGQAVDILTALKHNIANNDYLKGYWLENPDKEEDKTVWLVSANRKTWIKEGEKSVEVTVATVHKSHALVEFHRTHPDYEVSWIEVKSVMEAERKKFNERHNPVATLAEIVEV